jgi:ubiquinone/menaquinone biosynthesis C-methylase UbiE
MDKNINEASLAQFDAIEFVPAQGIAIPEYLSRHYWWAYIHPWAVAFFDHLWIVNLILLGNYKRLRDAALAEFTPGISGNVLQLACVYGDVTPRLAERVGADDMLDVVDVLPIQLRNLKRKLSAASPVRLLNMDSSNLELPSGCYDWVMLFFLLHEQPAEVRARTLREAFRVVKPGGKVLIVDFAKPRSWNPFRYLWCVFLAVFEPFALDLWWNDITDLLPTGWRGATLERQSFFGGLFQKVVVSR